MRGEKSKRERRDCAGKQARVRAAGVRETVCVSERGEAGGGTEIVSILTLQNYSLDSLRLDPQRMTKALLVFFSFSASLLLNVQG